MITLSLNQTADYLGLSKYSVKALIDKEKLIDIAVTSSGKTRHIPRITKDSVDAYLDKMRVTEKKLDYVKSNSEAQDKHKSTNVVNPSSIVGKLDKIESKLDKLISLWS